ncbi:Bromodomain and PHD finger-containing protein 3 [Spatholobus suberectus]|nr:Bromodomain and PHD finger-containing protein 3 [Spatholobus suberectus]
MLATGSSSNVFARVYPTQVISGPQTKPLKSILSGNKNSLSGLSLMPQPRSEDTMPSINLPELSLASQSRPENFVSFMPSNNLTELSLVHQPRSEDIINLSELSLVSQPRPKDSMYDMPSNNIREMSLVYQQQPWPTDSMSSLNPLPLSQPKQGESIPSKNLSGSTILPSLAANFSNESNTSLYGLGTSYQPRDFQVILDSPNFNNSTCTMQTSHEQVLHQVVPYTPPATYII